VNRYGFLILEPKRKTTMIINMTPHSINVIVNGVEIATFPPSGDTVRIESTQIESGEVDGIPAFIVEYGKPAGVPPVMPGIYYIVSGMVKSAMPERTDFVAPAAQVRNEKGQVVGCAGFIV
jgi:hypothetical protein